MIATTAQTRLDATSCLYLYGIVDRVIPEALIAGAVRDGRSLETTGAGRVAAVHSCIDVRDLDGIEADLADDGPLAALARHHDEVVTALALAGPVLPVRMGTVLSDREALLGLIATDQAGLADALDRVRGRAEWRVRIRAVADDDGAPADGATSGTTYLMGRKAERERAEQRRTALAALDEALAFHADAAVGPLLSAAAPSAARAYLVAEKAQHAFVAAADEVRDLLARFGCVVELRGPLPVYSFADLQLGSATHG